MNKSLKVRNKESEQSRIENKLSLDKREEMLFFQESFILGLVAKGFFSPVNLVQSPS